MVGGLIAANSSTILTHLNWGASYLVHDFYRRFMRQDAERDSTTSRPAASPPSACSSAPRRSVYLLDTAKDTFDIILQVGAGTGLLYLVRWFWWRVNAWCEIVGDGQLVRRLDRAPRPADAGHRVQHAHGAPHHRRDHDGLLGGDGVSRAGNRSRRAHRVLPQGAARRTGLDAHP